MREYTSNPIKIFCARNQSQILIDSPNKFFDYMGKLSWSIIMDASFCTLHHSTCFTFALIAVYFFYFLFFIFYFYFIFLRGYISHMKRKEKKELGRIRKLSKVLIVIGQHVMSKLLLENKTVNNEEIRQI